MATLPLMGQEPLLILMDGHAMVHRAWHAIRSPLNVSRTGEDVHGVYGFLNTFLREVADRKPTHCAIAFDMPGPTFRHLEYDEYKAHRPPSPPELRAQFPHVRRIMEAFGVPIFERQGYEADDVIGTLCRLAEESGLDTVVLTGDTDELQLVSPNVRVLLSYGAGGRTLYDVAAVGERYGGLRPEAVADVKALTGDTSDNIPGVPGVGNKTAIRLLTEYGSVEGIYDHIDEIAAKRTRESLRENREQALRGKFLTTIVKDVPIELDLDAAKFWEYDRAKVIEVVSELEFFSIVGRVPDPRTPAGPVQVQMSFGGGERETAYRVVDTREDLDSLVAELDSPSGFGFAAVADGDNPTTAELVGLSFSNAPDAGWYVPLGHEEGRQLAPEDVLSALRPVLESEAIPKAAHNANYSMTLLARTASRLRGWLSTRRWPLTWQAGRPSTSTRWRWTAFASSCSRCPISSAPAGSGRPYPGIAAEAADFTAADADVASQVRPILENELQEKDSAAVFRDVELPLASVLVRMQLSGVGLDVPMLERMSAELGEQVSAIEAGMFNVVGHEFNINSSQQLGDVLFKELRLPPTRRTQKGFSTDASSLEGLKHVLDQGTVEDVDPKAREVLDRVLEYRQITKIKSTYVDALPQLVNRDTGRIHTTYNQTGSATGRVSSDHPNVQNIPVRTELGRRVRQAFVVDDPAEWTLLAVDYSQIELRILAHLSKDPGLLEAFRAHEDVHSATAASVYDVSIDAVTDDMRRIAKIMNFGVVYGLSPFGISQQTGLSADEGRAFIDAYFGKYPGIQDYIHSTKEKVMVEGYVQTVRGRRRYIPEIQSSNFRVRSSGERMAINMPIQGTAADAIKVAMVRLQRRIEEMKSAGHDDRAGARRADLRGAERRGRAGPGNGAGDHAGRARPRRAAGRRDQGGRKLGRHGVATRAPGAYEGCSWSRQRLSLARTQSAFRSRRAGAGRRRGGATYRLDALRYRRRSIGRELAARPGRTCQATRMLDGRLSSGGREGLPEV